MLLLLLLGLSGIVSPSLSTCVGKLTDQCSCNLTSGSGEAVLGQLNAEDVDWRVVVLAGLTGALASSLVVIVLSLVALLKTDPKINPDTGDERNKRPSPKDSRPISSTSSSNDSWATPRRRSSPIDSPRDWPEKLKFTQQDQPSPRWSHGNTRVWPGSASNLSTF